MRIGEEANFNVEITPQAPIGVVIGDCAKMDVQKAITYVESGKKEIEKAVEDGKDDFDDHAADKTQDFDDNAVNKTNAFNQNAVNKTQDFDDNAAIKQAAVDASAAEAKQWAIGDPTEPDGYSSKYWAGQAHSELSDLQSDVAAIQDVIPSEASETNKLTDKDYVDTALALKANASNTVTTDTAQTISARKTFGDRIQRSSNIDQTSTTGSVEIQAFNVLDKDSNSVSMFNTARSSTRNYQSMRAYNANVASGNWMDLRVNVQDDGIGYVNIDKGASVENRNLTKSTSSKIDTYVATMGWVNDASKSTNVVHRDGTETISGAKTFTSNIVISKSEARIIYKDSDIERGVTPTSNINHTIANWQDKNGAGMGYIQARYGTDGKWGMGFQVTNGNTWQGVYVGMDMGGNAFNTCVAPTEDTNNSTQIDTVGARNTKLGSMFQVVASLPATPDPDTFYFIEES